jgi:hypothetical protein
MCEHKKGRLAGSAKLTKQDSLLMIVTVSTENSSSIESWNAAAQNVEATAALAQQHRHKGSLWPASAAAGTGAGTPAVLVAPKQCMHAEQDSWS